MAALLAGRASSGIIGVKEDTQPAGDAWTQVTATDLSPNGTLQPAGAFIEVEVYHVGVGGVLEILTRAQAGSDAQPGAFKLAPTQGKSFALEGLGEDTLSIRAQGADVDYLIHATTQQGTET